MTWLISKQDAINAVSEYALKHTDLDADKLNGLVKVIMKLPEPVQHGRWYIQRFGDDARCSECGMSFKDVYDIEDYDRYCRHCGARMLGVAIKKWE